MAGCKNQPANFNKLPVSEVAGRTASNNPVKHMSEKETNTAGQQGLIKETSRARWTSTGAAGRCSAHRTPNPYQLLFNLKQLAIQTRSPPTRVRSHWPAGCDWAGSAES